jgi:CBS domain-containing protein
MAALFGGASHALLASIVLAFETTRQPVGLLPLLTGCTAAYLIAVYLGRHSIMTEKLARRGVTLRTEYALDYLSRVPVRTVGVKAVATLRAGDTVGDARAWLASGAHGMSHQGFPVIDDGGLLVGVLTRRDILDASRDDHELVESLVKRAPIVVFDDNSLRDAADLMVIEHVGRLPVVTRDDPQRVVGIISRSDLLAAHAPRLREAREAKQLRRAFPDFAARR